MATDRGCVHTFRAITLPDSSDEQKICELYHRQVVAFWEHAA